MFFFNQIFNINIENIVDTTPDENPIPVPDGQRTGCCIKLGENGYYRNDPELCCKHGELHDIKINNVSSEAFSAVNMNCSVYNAEVHNVRVGSKGIHAFSASFITSGKHNSLDKETNITRMENILVDGVTYSSKVPDAVPFFFNNLLAKNVRVVNVSADCEKMVEEYQVRTDSEQIQWT